MLGKLIKGVLGPGQGGPASAEAPAAVPAAPSAPPAAPASTFHMAAEQPQQFQSADAYRGKTFITFISDSRSDALGGASHSFADICRAEGYDYRLIDLRAQSWSEELSRLLARPEEICGVLSSMGIGDGWVTATPGGTRPLWQNAGIPFVSCIGDHPAYYWDRHMPRGPGHASLYVFREHIDAALAWFGPQQQMGLTPIWPRDLVPLEAIDFRAKASGPVCFFKHGNNPQRLLDFWRSLPQPMSDWLLEISHSFDMFKVGHGLKPLHLLVDDFLRERSFFAGPPVQLPAFMVAQLDDYARRVKSTFVAESLLDLPVRIFGDNWGHVDFTGRRATHHAGLSYFKTRDAISEALALVDMSPNTESAPHDRFLCAAGRHTFCLNNTQHYYRDNYEAAATMLYEYDRESLRDKVAGLLADPARHIEYGIAAAARAQVLHAPAAAVRRTAEFVRMVRFAASSKPFAGQQDFLAWPPKLE